MDLRKNILLIFSNNLKARASCVSGGMIVVVEDIVVVDGGDDAQVVCWRVVLPFAGFDRAGKQEGGSGSPAGCFVIPNALISLPIVCCFCLLQPSVNTA